MSLEGEEVAVDRSGTSSTTYKHAIHSESERCAGTGPLHPGVPLRFDGAFTIPAAAPPSFKADSNEIVWALRLRVRKSRLATLDAEVKLDVGVGRS